MYFIAQVLKSTEYGICLLLGYCVFLALYRTLLHPLRHYSGPAGAKLTDWYAGYGAIKGDLHLRAWGNHTQYGPMAAPNVYSIFNALDPRMHHSKRRAISQVLSESSVRAFEPVLAEQVDIFLHQLMNSASSEPANSEPVNISDRSRRFGMEVAVRLAFGHSLGLQTSAAYRPLLDAVEVGNYQFNFFMQLFPGAGRDDQVKDVRSKHAEHDLLSFLPDDMPLSEVWSEGAFFLIAGGDTIACGISAQFFHLSRNPECYRQLAAEIRSTFSDGASITSSAQLASCRYLRATIDETLRLSPPIPGTLWWEQASEDSGPLVVDGHLIPRGTQLGVNTYALHHNEDYFPEPHTFRPERWLVGSSLAAKTTRGAFVPFSIGTRGCPGKVLAYLEMSLIIAKTLWYFDFEMAPGKLGLKGQSTRNDSPYGENGYNLYDMFGASHVGPYLRFRPRGEGSI
ncbi:Uu.00g044300.m01.CDS01 [Anthostomella pinea]|uniref:Uu.00g044300.m01.CDS01 n=1 Tax=Anthostomella pinea TaxID=933095 RepID=A0AAI8VBG0_9PEZI|nr:Uu.00g044300.m01.CDS01 [Anthostomella pinea]